MSERMEAIKAQLTDTRKYLIDVGGQVGNRQETEVYSDGLQWTVRQVIVHIADTNKSHNFMVQNIANGKDLIPEDFDIERYNRGVTKKTADKTVEEALVDLEKSLQILLDWIDTIDDATLDAKGRHATLKIMSIGEILDLIANHERKHMDEVAESLNITV